MPTKFSGFEAAFASSVIGSVDVLEPQNPSLDRYFSVPIIILFFKSMFSKTASIIRSHPSRSSSLAVGTIRLSNFSPWESNIVPRFTAFATRPSE